jgi:hypothetical protein
MAEFIGFKQAAQTTVEGDWAKNVIYDLDLPTRDSSQEYNASHYLTRDDVVFGRPLRNPFLD